VSETLFWYFVHGICQIHLLMVADKFFLPL